MGEQRYEFVAHLWEHRGEHGSCTLPAKRAVRASEQLVIGTAVQVVLTVQEDWG